LAQKIAERGFIVLNVNYTLASAVSASLYPTPSIASVPYTIGVRDIMAAVELVKLKASEFHIDDRKISIGGGSAGGHLALMTAAAGATTFNCVISAAGPTDLVLAAQTTQFPATVWIVKSIYGDNQSVLKSNSPLHQVNNILARRVYLLHQEKDNLVPVDHVRNFMNAARSRFQGALETTILNDPLPEGTPYEYSPLDKLTHNFDTPLIINAVGNFLANKCY
jgi:acetyl esterase/lipase